MASHPLQDRGKGRHPDQNRPAAPLQPAKNGRSCGLLAQLSGKQCLGQRVQPAKPNKTRDHHGELRGHRRGRVEELGNEGDEKPMDFGFSTVTSALSRKAVTRDFPATLAMSAVAAPADRIIRHPIQTR